MRAIIGAIGGILGYFTVLGYVVLGFLMLNEAMGVAGVLMGFILPIPTLMGFWVSTFTSWSAFIGSVIWWFLIFLMVSYGDEG